MAYVSMPQHGNAPMQIDLSDGFEIAVDQGRIVIQVDGYQFSGARRVWAVPFHDGVVMRVTADRPRVI